MFDFSQLLDKAKTGINDFVQGAGKPGTIRGMDPNAFAILAGNVGSTISGPNSIMGKVGDLAAQRGQSAQLNDQRQQMLQLLAGHPITPKGVPGPSEVKVNSDGYNITGDLPKSGLGTLEAGNPEQKQPAGGQAFSPFYQALMGQTYQG